MSEPVMKAPIALAENICKSLGLDFTGVISMTFNADGIVAVLYRLDEGRKFSFGNQPATETYCIAWDRQPSAS